MTERSVAWLRPGLPAVARILSGKQVRGILRYIAPAADPAARTYRIEVEAANPGYRIREGVTADIAVEVDVTMAHFVTPALLSLADDGAIGLKTVDARNRVRFRPVDILQDTPHGVWLGGLPTDIRVITVGQDFVSAGQEVAPVGPDESDPGPGSDRGPGRGPGAEMPAAAWPAGRTPAPPPSASPRSAS